MTLLILIAAFSILINWLISLDSKHSGRRAPISRGRRTNWIRLFNSGRKAYHRRYV